ncbi:hypothetical protein HPB49_011349 [Dermacentor silvarum]|uniref:Uncharacterized protein n=1 Tax=Dermacentor silvarum TaxID=543639 RepID=A0ACB8CET7_DERSI|nr:hypothetical protein HPB49_011349 [Dermacentor silvarum]
MVLSSTLSFTLGREGTVCEDEMKQLGLGASVVKKLVDTVGRCDSMFVFTDRYFTGFKLADFRVEKYLTVVLLQQLSMRYGSCPRLDETEPLSIGPIVSQPAQLTVPPVLPRLPADNIEELEAAEAAV